MDNIQQPDLYQNLNNNNIITHTCDLHVHNYYTVNLFQRSKDYENNLVYSWREASIHHNIQCSNFTFI